MRASVPSAMALGLVGLFGVALRAGPADLGTVLDPAGAAFQGERFVPQPGAWVSYRVTFRAPARLDIPSFGGRLRVSLPLHPDTQNPPPKDQYWLEMEFGDAQSQEATHVALKVLVSGDPRQKGSIQRMILQGGNRVPMEMTRETLDRYRKQDTSCMQGDCQTCSRAGGKMEKLETRRIYTEAGWLNATHYAARLPGGQGRMDSWYSPEVPLFGLVRTEMPAGFSLELEGFGTGALSRIDETRAVPLPDAEALKKELERVK